MVYVYFNITYNDIYIVYNIYIYIYEEFYRNLNIHKITAMINLYNKLRCLADNVNVYPLL